MDGDNESLAPEEKAYFDSRGETEVKADPPAATPEVDPADAVVESDDDTASEIEAEADPSVADQQQAPKTVPLAALTKTRQEVKDAKQRAEKAERLAQTLADRWNEALNPAPAQAEHAEEMPADDDPVAQLKWLTGQVATSQKEARDQLAQQAEQKRQNDEVTRVVTKVQKDYQAAKAADPAFEDAYQALIGSMAQEYRAMGYTDEQIRPLLTQQELAHARYIEAEGLDIKDYITTLAASRGWQRKPAAAKVDPAKEVGDLADRVDGSTSLSGAGGAAPRILDAEAIANMKPEEFEAWLSKPGNQQKFRRLAGG